MRNEEDYMIKQSSIIISIFVISMLSVCIYRNMKLTKKSSRNVTKLMFIAWVSALGYSLIFISDDYKVMSIGHSISFACNTWMCYYMLSFAVEYVNKTGNYETNLTPKAMSIIRKIIMIDNISLFLNVAFEHSVEYSNWVVMGENFLLRTLKPAFYVHVLLCYVLFFISMKIYWKRQKNSPNLYKIKYRIISVLLFLVVVSNLVYLLFEIPVNVEMFLYCVSAAYINHVTSVYVPGYLLKYMYKEVIDNQKDLVVMFNNEDVCIYMNKSAQKVWGDKYEYFQEFDEVYDIRNAFSEKYTNVNDDINNDVIFEIEGEEYHYTIEYDKLVDKRNKYMGCFFIMHDITKERALQKKYRDLATFDALTGIYNRSYFMEAAEKFMRRNPYEKYLIITSDLRQFKAINDIFGDGAGDTILCAIANKLRENDDNNRVYGRIGSDSFALCMPKKNFSPDSYLTKSQGLLKQKSSDFVIINHIGIYEVEDVYMSVSTMCDRATLAINAIKDDLQQEIAYYTDDLRKQAVAEQEILKDLSTAFDEKQFEIYLQPQFSHSSKEIVGAETLVRWRHPKKGMISPSIFIPLIEKNGLVSTLDQYVWESACMLLQKWSDIDEYKHVSISVNISPKDFYYLDLYDVFMALINKYHIEPYRLKLEITESAVMQDIKKQIELIEKLQSEGFIVEMDDFGSGYSSLNTLKDIPVDILKMDMKFMEKSINVERSANIMQMIVAMADKLGMPVIAEGVENKEQADFLSNIGCDIIQGYYYAEPMSVDNFEEILKKYPYREVMKGKFGSDNDI